MRNFLLTIALAVGVATIPGSVLATTACNSSTACGVFENTYSASSTGGVAIHGEANSGIGVRGTSVTNTGFYGSSSSDDALTPGVEGESTSTNHDVDAAAAFGLAGYSSASAAPAYGVLGYGNTYGLYGYTTSDGSSTGYGVFGIDASTGSENVAVEGDSNKGTGFYGQSSFIPLEVYNPKTNAEVYLAEGPYYLLATEAAGEVSITTAGNEELSGTLTTSKSTYSATRGASGAVRTAYGARTTTPELQDVGEAQLVSGHANVPIEPAFADSIDMRRPYYVFITPEGDTNELYVTRKTPAGFTVRESNAGHATIAFQYRIVAKPLDQDDGRLPAYHRADARRDLPMRPGSRATPASPGDALRQKLGNAGYAKAVAALRTRLAGR